MAVEEARQMAEEVVKCIDVLVCFCDALEARDSVESPERWFDAAHNVAERARAHLDALRAEVDDWEVSVGLCTNDLDLEDDDEDDEDDALAEWA